MTTTYYVRLTVASGKVSSDLSNFPILIDLSTMPAGFWTHLQHSDGGDIRMKTVGGALLPVDVVNINTGTKKGLVAFNADAIAHAADSSWDIHYGNPSDTLLANGDPHGRNAVWSDYQRVFIFFSTADRCGSGNDATLGGTSSLDGNGYLSCTSGWAYSTNLSIMTQFSMGVNVSLNSVSGSSNQCACTYTTNSDLSRVTIDWRGSSSPKKFGIWDTTNTWLQGSETVAASTIYRVNGTYNGSTGRAEYVNGVAATQSSITSKLSAGTTGLFGMGAAQSLSSTGLENLTGKVSYAYIRAGVLSAAWIAAEAANWNGSAFYTLGSEQVQIINASPRSFGIVIA